MEYKIGFYNSDIEEVRELKETCNIVFSDWKMLKKHIRDKDIIVVKDLFHFFNIETQDLLDVLDCYDISVLLISDLGKGEFKHTSQRKLEITMMTSFFKCIKEEKELIIRLLS